MNARRIDFKSADAARFNALRDEWRSAAAGCALSRSGLRVASVLPTFVNRKYGFAFPTDDELTKAIGASNLSTAKRGLISLEGASLIERTTVPRRDRKGVVVGKVRRIYLTIPEPKVQPDQPKVHFDGEPKVHPPKVQPEPKVQNTTTEGAYGCTNILDSNTPDKDSALETENLIEGTYTRTDPSVISAPSVSIAVEEKKAQPQPVPSVLPAAPASSPLPEQNSYLAAKTGDEGLALTSDEIRRQSPEPAPSVRWQDWKHPKVLQGRPLSRKPFPAPRSIEAAHAFFRKHHVPESEWAKLLPNLMDGQLYEFDIEPWMDAA